MTGNEKTQTVIDIINEERKRIVTGNVVEISSSTLTSKSLTLDDQLKVLDVLANDKGWIKYTFPYFSGRKVETIVDRLKPDLIRLMPGSLRPKQLEEPFIYTIEVLDSFGTEVAPKSTDNIQQSDTIPLDKIKYQLTYNPSVRELWLNDVLLAKPNYGSENHKFLQYFVTENNTGEQEVKDLLAFMNKPKLTKRPTQILTDVRITGDVKRVFFPNASKQSIEFQNPITFDYAKEHELPEINLELAAKDSQKQSD